MTFSKIILKRFISVLTVAVLLVASLAAISVYAAEETTAPATEAQNKIIYGDVNGDKTVDIKDVTFIQKVLVKREAEPENFLKVGNVDGDGDKEVNIKDATTIQMYIAKMIKTLPNYKPDEEGFGPVIYRP